MTLEKVLLKICHLPMGDRERDSRMKMDAYQNRSHPSKVQNTPAAVMVALTGTTFEDAKLLLTYRSAETQTHSSQVAFPGGRIEENDSTSVEAALRECEEEVGISATSIRILGALPQVYTVTGRFEVEPIVGFTPKELSLTPQPKEVQHAEWVSIRELKATRKTEMISICGDALELPVFYWGSYRMWGLTAWIFDSILDRYDTLSVITPHQD